MWNAAFAGSLPIQGTDVAGRWDNLYWFLVWLSVFFFVLVVGAMIYFCFEYRHKPGRKTKYITGNHLLEAFWIVIPTILLLVIFGWGYSVYNGMTSPPTDAYEVRVIGKQWLWNFQYTNGQTTTNELYVPLNKPVRLVMTSEDVLHDFFIPNFRIKQDVVPGMYSSVWFEAKVPGIHQIFCAMYCGTSHSGMLAKLIVLDENQWKTWDSGGKLGDIPRAADGAGQPLSAVEQANDRLKTAQAAVEHPTFTRSTLADQGKKVFENRGCVSCHSTDGSPKIGPTQKGLFGSTVQLLDGKTLVADENYIRESIEKPQAKIVKGFSPVMPTFQGLINETEMNALIAYIKSLK
jgi:cytochrome c oxidase subunit 2